MPQAVSPFELDTFNAEPPYHEGDGLKFGVAHIDKTFHGDLNATSTVEMLSVQADNGGAGYVALERIVGILHGKSGSFALLHIGTMTKDGQWAKWPISPGSGTGELQGISGEGRIEIASDGAHTFFLDYELSPDNHSNTA